MEFEEKALSDVLTEMKRQGSALAKIEQDIAESARKSGGEADAKLATVRDDIEAKYLSLQKEVGELQSVKMSALAAQVEEQKGRIAELEKEGQRPGNPSASADFKSIGSRFVEHMKANESAFRDLGTKARRAEEMPALPLTAKDFLTSFSLARKSVLTDATTRFVPLDRGADVDLVARRVLRMRNLIPSIATDRGVVEYLRYQGASAAAKSITSITSSSTTATVTITAHGYRTNDKVRIVGATQTEYNGDYRITVTGANTFTYKFAGSGTTPATGTKTAIRLNQFGAAAGVAEGGSKPESQMYWETAQCKIESIPHFITASNQVLADLPGLESKINNELLYGLDYMVDYQSLWGSGASPQLAGIMSTTGTLTSAWSAGASGDTKVDAIRRGRTKLEEIDRFPTVAVLSPSDWQDVELAKGTDKHYIWVSVSMPGNLAPVLWQMPVVVTTAMDAGDFLLMDTQSACNFYTREDANIRMSDSHDDYFTRNLVAIRAELRLGLAITNPEAIVIGSFDSAPA